MLRVGNGLGDRGGYLGDTVKQLIAALSGFIPIPCAERNPDALLGVVRLVEGVVAPPRAVVVPDVMILGGAAVGAGAELRCFHAPIPAQGVGHLLSLV